MRFGEELMSVVIDSHDLCMYDIRNNIVLSCRSLLSLNRGICLHIIFRYVRIGD
jgi:hypothetical protein